MTKTTMTKRRRRWEEEASSSVVCKVSTLVAEKKECEIEIEGSLVASREGSWKPLDGSLLQTRTCSKKKEREKRGQRELFLAWSFFFKQSGKNRFYITTRKKYHNEKTTTTRRQISLFESSLTMTVSLHSFDFDPTRRNLISMTRYGGNCVRKRTTRARVRKCFFACLQILFWRRDIAIEIKKTRGKKYARLSPSLDHFFLPHLRRKETFTTMSSFHAERAISERRFRIESGVSNLN